MTKKTTKALELSAAQANALMFMLDDEMETVFTYGDFDPINGWDVADLYAYRLLAYQTYKRWYIETHGDTT